MALWRLPSEHLTNTNDHFVELDLDGPYTLDVFNFGGGNKRGRLSCASLRFSLFALVPAASMLTRRANAVGSWFVILRLSARATVSHANLIRYARMPHTSRLLGN